MLQIRLLGQFDVRSDGKRVVISSRAGQSLLAYLLLTAGIPHRREKLAGTLWPDLPEDTARKNLRQELWRIRKALSVQQSNVGDYLLAEELTITFNRNMEYWLDVAQLERPDLDLQSLTSNLSLYQGELLPGFYDDWVVLERERIQSVFDSKMNQLLRQLITAERWMAVEEQAERWLALGNTWEPAYRALMLAYGARGDIAKVSSIYQRCMDELDEKFGLEPSAETRALYDGLLKGSHMSLHVAQPFGTVTFLFTDIEGSTRLLDKLGEQYAVSLADHHKIMRAAIQKWNGREVDTQGDAFFVTFARALDAVECAAEAQRALAAQAWPQDEPIRVRMGLHTGEPLIASTGYVGMDVHRAARIGDAAHGGQVLLSQTTRELIMHNLPEGIRIQDLGEHRLKDMKYPTPIYQLVIDGLSYDFPPLRTKFLGTEAPTPGEPPFKGMQYFDEIDSDLFFGRELLTAKIVSRLRDTQFLSVIIGASGSGKSSLVRAGLIPTLKKGELLVDGSKPPDGSPAWQVYVITPTAHPLEALAIGLHPASDPVAATATLADDLLQDPRSLALFLARQNPKGHTLLVIDQFEELFTLCRDDFEREAFVDNLLTTLSQGNGNITLILTLRADFYAHLAQYPELRDAVARQQEYIGPMTTEELRRAIEEPAQRGHWSFEPGLVDLILRDVGDEPGALPLLSHALLETWKRRAGHTLTLKGYADAGGVRGAIAHTAESLYQNLPMEEQGIARNIFLRLTELGEGTEDTRRRASFDELISEAENVDEVRRVLNRLADARLVTLGESTAEVAHEALIREWPALREWLNQDREGLRLHRHLTEAAYEWELLGRDTGALYRGAHLAQAREWAALHPKALNAGERAFLTASLVQEQQEEREREDQRQRELEAARKLVEMERAKAEEQTHSANRLRTRNRVITAVGSIAVILALLVGLFGTRANSNFSRAEAQRLALEANRLLLEGGSPEQIALLSLRSIQTQYTPEGDAALAGAVRLDYPMQLFIHPGPVRVAAFSTDGQYLVTGTDDYRVILWKTITGQEVRQFVGHTGPVTDVGISPDGKYILTGSQDKTARLWDMATGKEIRRFMVNAGLFSARFSPDGNYILTGGKDNIARLWDTSTGKEIRQFIGHTGPIKAVFSPDGKHILTGSSDKTAKLWDVSTGKEMIQFIGHTNALWAIAFSPDGNSILTGSQDGTARLWDAKTGTELQRFMGHTNYVVGVAFSPDGKKVFTASDDSTARLWDPKTGQELHRYTSIIFLTGLAISPDGKLLATCSGDGTVRLWQVKPRVELASFDENDGGVSAVAFSPDGRSVVTGGLGGIARLWDVRSGQELRKFVDHTDGINYGVAFSPDGKYVLTGGWDKTVRLWDPQTGQEVRQFIGHMDGVNDVAFSPDGKYIVTASTDKTLRLWDSESGQEVRKFSSDSALTRVAFSPDGNYLVSANTAGTAQLWDITSDRLLREFTTTLYMNGIAFSPDGKTILTGNDDGIVWMWDAHTGQEVRQFIGHIDALWTVTFSPDGRYIASASADGTARLWDTQTGQELRRFVGHTAGVENVVFSPDGKYVLTGSDDGTAQLWDVDYHTTMEYLCSRLLRDFTDDERLQYGITDDASTCPKP